MLQPGDVLLRARHPAEGEAEAWCTAFLQMEDLLDASVGGTVRLTVERGGEEKSFDLEVGNLHSLSPASVVEVGGCNFHALSFQQVTQ